MSHVTYQQLPIFFQGIAYDLQSGCAILPDGRKFDSPRFNVVFGGNVFEIDPYGNRTTRYAFSAFREAYMLGLLG